MDFSIEGSISANCHGWQNNAGPIGNYISDLVIDRGNGAEKAEGMIAQAVIGGWGLCGKILGASYKTTKNLNVASLVSVGWAVNTVGRDFSGTDMLNIHLDSKWERAAINQHYYGDRVVVSQLKDSVSWWAPILVRHFPWLRWWAQRNMNLHKITSRNELLYTSVRHFTWPGQELFELFVPTRNAAEFCESAQPLIKKIKTFNTTVRDIQPDQSSLMPYAREPTRGFVVLAHQADQNAAVVRDMIDLAISYGGSFYLPYNRYATVGQFRTAYGNWEQFREFQVSETEWSRKYLGKMAE